MSRSRKTNHCIVNTLVLHQFGDNQEVIARGPIVETLHLNWRIDNFRVAPVCLPNTPFDVITIGDKLIDARGRRIIPKAQIIAESADENALGPRGSPLMQIVGIEIPKIAHRGVTIANMAGSAIRDDAFGRTPFAADDEIVASQCEMFEREWRRRQERPGTATSRTEK